MEFIRSPFFYVGDKYKLMPQLIELFPKNIDVYYEPFCGGGSSFLNVNAKKYIVNDIDEYVIKLHLFFKEKSQNKDKFINDIYNIIYKYGLSCSVLGITVPEELKKQYVKTYYAKYNKKAYLNMREDFNKFQSNMYLLYLLLIYGFNHMIRFNSNGMFNLPVGNVDFNSNVLKAIDNYLNFLSSKTIEFENYDYKDFLINKKINSNDFIYFDPPYLISQSEYNKLWNEEKEKELYDILDCLNKEKVIFGITNLLNHKGKTNNILLEWSKKYKVYNIESNYISFNDNSIKVNSNEVYITNANY
ncbi:MAG: DNA adenine methylase [Abditibacteriota bacterium]|nr:DNA adenine methylase [Abditibacteriota bacterium]